MSFFLLEKGGVLRGRYQEWGALVIMQWSGRRTEEQADLISTFAALVLSVLREIPPWRSVLVSFFFLPNIKSLISVLNFQHVHLFADHKQAPGKRSKSDI